MTLVGKIMCYAIVALAMDLIWGYTGILSLGHGLFFALGGYAMGMYLMRSIGATACTKRPARLHGVPRLEGLPWYWSFTDGFWYAALLVVLVPGVLAFVFGFFAFRSRIKGVYFSIITQALTYARRCCCSSATTRASAATTASPTSSASRLLGRHAPTRVVLFMITGAALVAFLLPRPRDRHVEARPRAHRHPRRRDARDVLGLQPGVLQALHLDAVGGDLRHRGALYVPQVGIINPSEMSPANSIEIAIWTAVGGRGTLIGPVIGAAVVNLAKGFFTQALPDIGSTCWACCSSSSRCTSPAASRASVNKRAS